MCSKQTCWQQIIGLCSLISVCVPYFFSSAPVSEPHPEKPHHFPLYEAVRHHIKIGDVIAFGGHDIGSDVVKFATKSHYSHVGIVFKVHQSGGCGDSVLMAESHIDTSLPSVGTGDRLAGVQFQWVTGRLSVSSGRAWWVPLQTELGRGAIAQMQAWLTEVEAKKTPYDWEQAVGAGIDLPHFRNRPDFSALFCSELVTRALQLARVVPPQINPSEQTPANVLTFPCWKPPVLIKD
jgi:hypothetical protein